MAMLNNYHLNMQLPLVFENFIKNFNLTVVERFGEDGWMEPQNVQNK